MVILNLTSNIPQDETSFVEFSAKATELLSQSFKTNSSFIQIVYTHSKIVFGNQSSPSTLITVSKNDLSDDDAANVITPLSKLLDRLIGSPPPTTIIRFEEMKNSLTAWNGRLLG